MENPEEIDKIETVYDVLDRLDFPTGEEEFIFPKYRKGKELRNFLDYKEVGHVAGLEHPQDTSLGQLITKEVFGKNGNRYAHVPLQSSCDRTHSDKKFPETKQNIWTWNNEVILETGEIIPDPIVFEKDDKLIYGGKTIESEINKNDIFDTLIKAGLLKEPEEGVYRGRIYFKGGESAVRSGWYIDEKRFYAYAGRPSGSYSDGLSVFEKTDEKRKTK